jgi:hypothetical protein
LTISGIELDSYDIFYLNNGKLHKGKGQRLAKASSFNKEIR